MAPEARENRGNRFGVKVPRVLAIEAQKLLALAHQAGLDHGGPPGLLKGLHGDSGVGA
jgi:hypothetical protein